jgi:hypothetical protein
LQIFCQDKSCAQSFEDPEIAAVVAFRFKTHTFSSLIRSSTLLLIWLECAREY